jgi:hypothetical protein
MKFYTLLVFLILFHNPSFTQNNSIKEKITTAINQLESFHNTLFEGYRETKYCNERAFYSLFFDNTIKIDKLFPIDDYNYDKDKSLSDYLETLKREANTYRNEELMSLMIVEGDTLPKNDVLQVWCIRSLKKSLLAHIQKKVTFKITFKKKGDEYLIYDIESVTDSDSDGIEDNIDACKDSVGIAFFQKKCNGCPDLNDDKIPDNYFRYKKKKKCRAYLFTGLGLVTAIPSIIYNDKINAEWETYLNKNNGFDVEQKYKTKQCNYYLSQAGIVLGSVSFAYGIEQLFEILRNKKKERAKYKNLETQKSLSKTERFKFEAKQTYNGFGIVVTF